MEEIGAEKQEDKSGRYFLAISILVAAILVAGSIIYATGALKSNSGKGTANVQQPAPGQNSNLLELSARDVVLGDPNAPVTVIEYGDYQCPFCGKFFKETEPLIRENYVKTNKVKMVFRNLAFLGQESVAAAVAAECAKDQKKFWVYHDALYNAEIADGQENNGNLAKTLFVKLAQDVGLDVGSFTSCLDSGKYTSAVQQETSAAEANGINSTPTTFINGQGVQGAVPYSQFASAIDRVLQK